MTKYDWTLEATEGIGDYALRRLWKELGDHYQSAYDAEITRGASPEAAERTALEALGDAKAANDAYRKAFPPTRILTARMLARVLCIEAILGIALFSLLSPEFGHARPHLWLRIFALTNWILLTLTHLARYARLRKLVPASRLPAWIVAGQPSLMAVFLGLAGVILAMLQFVLIFAL